jgi:outer membrane protein TolC
MPFNPKNDLPTIAPMPPKIKIICAHLLLCLLPWAAMAQAPLSLEQLRSAARANYPEIRQKDISKQGYELEMQKLHTMLYPKMNFGLQTSWQTATTAVPNIVPGVDFKAMPRGQYKAYVDVNQMVWDGGAGMKALDFKASQQDVEQQKIEVSLQKSQEQVDFLFFSALLLQAQVEQLQLVRSTIENKLKQVQGAIANGVMLESNGWMLEAELIKNAQLQTEAKAQQTTVARMLSEWTGIDVKADAQFEVPSPRDLPNKPVVSRAEMHLFTLQNRAVDLGIAAIDAKNRPKLTAFSQLGVGRAGLNLLDPQIKPWAIVGARLSWDIYDWGAGKVEKEQLALQKELVKMQRDAFDRQTNLGLIQVEEDLDKLRKLLQQDNDLIRLRGKIKDIANAQLESGVITATEYIDRLNEETAANLAKHLHEIQVLMTQAKYGYITGNN